MRSIISLTCTDCPVLSTHLHHLLQYVNLHTGHCSRQWGDMKEPRRRSPGSRELYSRAGEIADQQIYTAMIQFNQSNVQ